MGRGLAATVLSLALLVLGAVVLGAHGLAGARTARSWYSGEQGGLADLAWRQVDCLERALDELVPEGATVQVAPDAGPLGQRLLEAAFRRGTVVAPPAPADVVLTTESTPGGGCEGVTLVSAPPSATPVPSVTSVPGGGG